MTQLAGVHLAVEEVSLAWLLAESTDTLGGAPSCGNFGLRPGGQSD